MNVECPIIYGVYLEAKLWESDIPSEKQEIEKAKINGMERNLTFNRVYLQIWFSCFSFQVPVNVENLVKL